MNKATSPTLMRINDGPDTSLILCFHPMGGGSDAYQRLAAKMSSTATFWMLEDPVIYAGLQYQSFDELVNYHVQCIESAMAVDTPVTLLGYCSGGPLAYQVGCKLSENGIPVSKLILLGQHVKGLNEKDGRYSFLASYLTERLSKFGAVVDFCDVHWEQLEALNIEQVAEYLVHYLIHQGITAVAENKQWCIAYIASLYFWREAAREFSPDEAKFDVTVFQKHIDLESNHGIKPWLTQQQFNAYNLSFILPPDKVDNLSDLTVEPYLSEVVRKIEKL